MLVYHAKYSNVVYVRAFLLASYSPYKIVSLQEDSHVKVETTSSNNTTQCTLHNVEHMI